MQKMSGADLHFAVADLKALEGKRIAKIRKTDSGIFLFKIGSEELLFQPGVRLHLTRQVLQGQGALDGFVAFLRKNFEGKTAARIVQYDSDRIVEIETKSKEKIVLELFRKGNIIAVGEDGNIASCLLKDEAGERRVARGERYSYPKATSFVLKIPETPIFAVKSDASGTPISYSCEGNGTQSFPSFSGMADFYYANQLEESSEETAAKERMKKLQSRLESQQKTLSQLGKEREEAKKSGDAVYAGFSEIDALLSLVRQMKKSGKNEEEINAALSSKKAKIKGTALELET